MSGRIRAILIMLVGALGVGLVAFGFLMTAKTSNARQIATGYGVASIGVLLAIAYLRVTASPKTKAMDSPVGPYTPARARSQSERGVIMAALLMVAAFFGVGIIPLWTSQRAAQGHSNNISNVKQLGTAMVLYMSDLQDTYPPSNQWLTLTKAYGSGEFHCFLSKAHFTYAMNDKLSSFPATSIEEPNATALIFEMKAQVPNAHGSQRDLDPHHGGGSVYGFTDTHAKFWRPGAEPVVRWNP